MKLLTKEQKESYENEKFKLEIIVVLQESVEVHM